MDSSRISRRDLLIRSGAASAGLLACRTAPGDLDPSAVAAAPTTITVLDHQATRLKLLRAAIPRFEAAMQARGMHISVRLKAGPTADNAFQTYLTIAYATGTAPDITSFPVSWTPDYILDGSLKDITALVRAWPDWQRYWYPVIRNAASVNGHFYFLPREATVYSLYYRQDLLRAHGISTAQPESWNDLLDVAREIKRKTGKYAINIPAGTQWGAGTFDEGFIHLMLGSGSPLYDEASRAWVVKSPGLLRVFSLYATLAREGLLPVGWLNSANPWVRTKYQGFPAGDLLITTSGSWAWEFDWGPQGAAPIPDLLRRVATWQFPSVDGKPFTTGGVGWVWAIAGSSPQANAAWEFVRFMATGSSLADDLVGIGAVSPRTDVARTQPGYGELPFLVAAEHTLTTSRSFPPRTGEAKIQQYVWEATQTLINGTANPDQAMNTFAAKARTALGPGLTEEQ